MSDKDCDSCEEYDVAELLSPGEKLFQSIMNLKIESGFNRVFKTYLNKVKISEN